MPEPQGLDFYADPFGLEYDGQVEILFEAHEEKKGKAHILAANWKSDKFGPSTFAFGSSVHLSYPYIIRSEGEIYCIPESWEANAVVLYRATRFPNEWVEESTC